ncbi:hypothetical protein BKA80DRAFT_258877 [Phyllosticta citrichinensis]
MLTAHKLGIEPSLESVRDIVASYIDSPNPPNLVPLCASISAEFLTPTSIYLKIASRSVSMLRVALALAETYKVKVEAVVSL